jgi:hypothetical protein
MPRAPGLYTLPRAAAPGFSLLLVTDSGHELRFAADRAGVVQAQLDDGPKFNALALSGALGVATDELFRALFTVEPLAADALHEGRIVAEDVVNEETGEVIVEHGHRVPRGVDVSAVTASVAVVATEHEARARRLSATCEERARMWDTDPFGEAILSADENMGRQLRAGELELGPRCRAALEALQPRAEHPLPTTLTPTDLVHIWLQFSEDVRR